MAGTTPVLSTRLFPFVVQVPLAIVQGMCDSLVVLFPASSCMMSSFKERRWEYANQILFFYNLIVETLIRRKTSNQLSLLVKESRTYGQRTFFLLIDKAKD